MTSINPNSPPPSQDTTLENRLKSLAWWNESYLQIYYILNMKMNNSYNMNDNKSLCGGSKNIVSYWDSAELFRTIIREMELLFGHDDLINLHSTDPKTKTIIDAFLTNTEPDLINKMFNFQKILGRGSYFLASVFTTASNNEYVFKMPAIRLSTEDKNRNEEDLFIDRFPYVLHEFFVGWIAVNSMLEENPCFCRTYGMVKCTEGFGDVLNSPNHVIDTVFHQQRTNFCDVGGKNIYILQEKAKGVSLDRKFLSLQDIDFVAFFLQIFFTMWKANSTEFKFVHFDLSLSNIMIEDRPVIIRYRIPKYDDIYPSFTDVYIKSFHKPTIIDYGLSKIEYDGEIFGMPNFRQYYVCTESGFAIFGDIHRILVNFLKASGSFGKRNHKLLCQMYMELFGKQTNTQWGDLYPILSDKKQKEFEDKNNYYNYTMEVDRTMYDLFVSLCNVKLLQDVFRREKIIYTWNEIVISHLEGNVINPSTDHIQDFNILENYIELPDESTSGASASVSVWATPTPRIVPVQPTTINSNYNMYMPPPPPTYALSSIPEEDDGIEALQRRLAEGTLEEKKELPGGWM
jgi:hypothetical protein